MAADGVFNLCSMLPDHKQYKIFSDNFFTSIPLLQKLLDRGIQYVGTVHANRLNGCSLPDDKELLKRGRGSFDWRVEEEIGVVATRWCDTRAVTLLSTYFGITPIDQVKRWEKSQRTLFLLRGHSLSQSIITVGVKLTYWILFLQNITIK